MIKPKSPKYLASKSATLTPKSLVEDKRGGVVMYNIQVNNIKWQNAYNLYGKIKVTEILIHSDQ